MSLPVHKVSTADLVAGARGWHRRQHDVLILEDPYGEALCGPVLALVLRYRPLTWLAFSVVLRPVLPAVLCVLMRARYADDALVRAMEEGVRQYVIIGAGMDSFAFRRPRLASRIQTYEIDHPVTQRRKKARMARAGLVASQNHHFVAADLSRVSAVDALAGSAFDMSRPAFLSLLGVAYYLTPETLSVTARSIAEHLPAGSRLTFDYMLDGESCGGADRELRQKLLKFTKRRGEPMRAAYSMTSMDALMADAGFRPVENFRMTELAEEYRRQLGSLPFEMPDLFGMGQYEVV